MSVTAEPQQIPSRRALQVLIVGAGFGGIAAAIELRRHGIGDVTILERAPDLGGTWFYNSYPGAACDVPSHLYSFSYAQRRDWSRLCSPQAEIQDYLRDVARTQQIDRLIHTRCTVTSCSWNEATCRWTVETEEGATYEADALILATGQLHQPARPRIEGADSFAGQSFHSAEWDHSYRLAGKRVAVVGTGASAVQLVPEIAREVDRLTVFQRTSNWFLPRMNRTYPALVKAAIELIPGVQAFRRRFMFQYCEAITVAIRHPRTFGRLLHARSGAFMRMQLKDPQLRAKVWPDYTFGCKRVLFSSQFLPALERPNVELVTEPIARMTPAGIVSRDGVLHELDCVIWATGFRTNDFMFPMEITGSGGRSLRQSWAGGAHAHLGMTIPGFPNMFVMYGPNTNTSGGSIVFYLELQAAYIRQALESLRVRGAGAIEVRPEVELASDRALQARFAGTAWTQCDSWYRTEEGRIVANWPGYMREYRQRAEQLVASEYRFMPAPDRAPLAGSQK
ncbi:MAG TPA: NAD(P)/FAD-dependent oxidoreductase [Solirubrobacteraceae bacterium]|jgi:cation diffusion facilitator CzcD-associated flavoprotein CzcO